MKEFSCIINGQILSYLDNEKEADSVLVFLHGWECNKHTLQGVFSPFLESHRVISIDFPGFGASSLAEEGFKLLDYSEGLMALLQKLRISSAHFIGHSFGGRVAIDLAARHPEMIDSITLINSGGIKNSSLKVQALKILAKAGKVFGLQRYKKWLYRYIIREDDVISAERSEALRSTFRNIIKEDLQEGAKNIRCPVLLLWGEKDRSTPLWHGKRWHELLPQSQLFIHPGDHFFFLKDADWTVEKIREFLSRW